MVNLRNHIMDEEQEQIELDEAEYSDFHKHILRHLIYQGVVKMSELRTYITDKLKMSRENAEQLDLRKVIETINVKIQNIHKLRIVNNEITCETEVVLMWLGSGDILKSHTAFTAQELEFFRLVMENIVLNERKFISGIDAINLVPKTLNKSNADDLLKKWCGMRYLKNIENVGFILDTRAVHEFEPYFIQNMKNFTDECNFCKKIVFQSVVCPYCMESLHKTCLGKYVKNIKKWPCCKNEFDENVSKLPTIINSKFTTLSQESQTQGECSTSSQSRKRKSNNQSL